MRALFSGMVRKILDDPEAGEKFTNAIREKVRSSQKSSEIRVGNKTFTVRIVGMPVEKSSSASSKS